MQPEPGCDLDKRLAEHHDAGQNAEQANDDPFDKSADRADGVNQSYSIGQRVDFIIAEVCQELFGPFWEIIKPFAHFLPQPQSATPAALFSLICTTVAGVSALDQYTGLNDWQATSVELVPPKSVVAHDAVRVASKISPHEVTGRIGPRDGIGRIL